MSRPSSHANGCATALVRGVHELCGLERRRSQLVPRGRWADSAPRTSTAPSTVGAVRRETGENSAGQRRGAIRDKGTSRAPLRTVACGHAMQVHSVVGIGVVGFRVGVDEGGAFEGGPQAVEHGSGEDDGFWRELLFGCSPPWEGAQGDARPACGQSCICGAHRFGGERRARGRGPGRSPKRGWRCRRRTRPLRACTAHGARQRWDVAAAMVCGRGRGDARARLGVIEERRGPGWGMSRRLIKRRVRRSARILRDRRRLRGRLRCSRPLVRRLWASGHRPKVGVA